MLDHVLEIIAIPCVWDLQCVDRFEKKPLCLRSDRRNVCPVTIDGEGEILTLALVAKK